MSRRGFEVGAWQGILAPARMPPRRDRAAERRGDGGAGRYGGGRRAWRRQGARPTGGTPEDYSGYLRQEVERWAGVVKESGATAEIGRRRCRPD